MTTAMFVPSAPAAPKRRLSSDDDDDDPEVILTSPIGTPNKNSVRRRLSRFRSPGKQQNLKAASSPASSSASSPVGVAAKSAAALLILRGTAPDAVIASATQAKASVGGGDLQQLLLSQLDLIQQQSEAIVRKDRKLRELQRENDVLRKRLALIEFRSKQPAEEAWQADASAIGNLNPAFLTTHAPYFVLQGQAWIRREQEEVSKILQHGEVPGWRQRLVAPSYADCDEADRPEDDKAYLRRHTKLELDEKRRKRWDIQRLREQRNVERLKARYEKRDRCSRGGPQLKAGPAPLPGQAAGAFDPAGITHIHISDTLPVCAFGVALPAVERMDFELQ